MIPALVALIVGVLAGLLLGNVSWLALLAALGIGIAVGAVGGLFWLFWWEHRGLPRFQAEETARSGRKGLPRPK